MSLNRKAVAMTLGAVIGVMSLATALTLPAYAAHGESTQGVTVRAVNPTNQAGSDGLAITLVAHSERNAGEDGTSCRPQDQNMECFGALRLTVPEMGGMKISHFVVHRIAIVGPGHGGGGGGDHGDEHGDEHSDGHTDGHGEETSSLTAKAEPNAEPTRIQVNGIAVIRNPGSSGFDRGTIVQVKLTLIDNGKSRYGDQVEVTVNEFVEGPVKPLIYQSGPVTVQQVQLHMFDRAR